MGARVWLITGATSGFGRAIAEAALAEGDTVVAAVRRPDGFGDLVDQVSVATLDVTDVDAMPAVVEQVLAEHGRIAEANHRARTRRSEPSREDAQKRTLVRSTR